MRFLTLAALLCFIPLSAGAQDACTADFGTHIGSPACPYQWVGVTAARFNGGGGFEPDGAVRVGFIGMSSQCRAEFGPGARMCRSEDVLGSDTLNLNDIPDPVGCWVAPSLVTAFDGYHVDATGSNLGNSLGGGSSCGGWQNSGSSIYQGGLYLNRSGGFGWGRCDSFRGVACCKPQPVPSPTSSLMLPIGVSGLAALSLIKNAS